MPRITWIGQFSVQDNVKNSWESFDFLSHIDNFSNDFLLTLQMCIQHFDQNIHINMYSYYYLGPNQAKACFQSRQDKKLKIPGNRAMCNSL